MMEAKKHGFRFTVIWYFSTIFLVFTAAMYIAFFSLFTTTGQMQERMDRYILLAGISDSVSTARNGFTAYFEALGSGDGADGDRLEGVMDNVDDAFAKLDVLEDAIGEESGVGILHGSICSRLDYIKGRIPFLEAGDHSSYHSILAVFDDLLESGLSDYLFMVAGYDFVESMGTAGYLETMRKAIACLIAVCFLVVILFSITFSKDLSTPVKAITESAHELARGNYDTPELKGARQLELASLEESINLMKKAVKERSEFEKELYERRIREAEMSKDLSRAHYLALQAQINPHFLFNALTTISNTALMENADRTVELANTMASFFRYTLEFRNEVSLGEELEFCRQYLMIQKKRFSDRLDFEIDCDASVSLLKIPPLVVEPFVENAVMHGLEPKEDGGRVVVSACLHDENFASIVVEDDGIGMDAVELPQQGRKGRIGIRNVEERLSLFFDNASSVDIRRTETGGTRVVILVPFNKD